jgi:predicted Zn-dependent protease
MRPHRLIAACLVLIWASTLPFESEAASNPSAHLRRLAAREQAELEQRGLILSDARLSAYLSDVVARLWAHVDSPLEKPAFRVLLDSDLDAQAYPDGACYLTTGILDAVTNEDQLAMILAHEIVHYVCQHASRIYDHLRQMGADHRDLRSAVDAAEDQADGDGLKMITKAGYCGRQVLPLMSNLRAAAAQRGAVDETLHKMDRRRDRIHAALTPVSPTAACSPGRSDDSEAFADRIAPALIANARVALQSGDFRQAARSISRFLAVRPDHAEAHYLQGDILRRQSAGFPGDRCVACYKKAIAIDPRFALAHRALGELYFKAGRCRDAVTYFESFLDLAPQHATIDYVKGYLEQCRQ